MIDDQQIDSPVRPATPGHAVERSPSAWSAWRTGGLSALVALVANLVVLVTGTAAGAEMSVLAAGAGQPMTVNAAMVVATTLLPLLLATGVLVLVHRRGARAWRLLASAGLVVGVVTVVMPLSLTATVGTKAVLALMHVITGLVWFVLVRRAAGAQPVGRVG